MHWDLIVGFAFGAGIAALTSPVGVSGAVFLLPVQLTVLQVSSPAVTPTNLLYNVVAVPGALVRYHGAGALRTRLVRLLVAGTVPGVIVGSVVRIYLLPGGTVFRLLMAGLLAPLGLSLLRNGGTALLTRPAGHPPTRLFREGMVRGLAFGAGLIGGLYGIGGGSLLAPVLVSSGYLVADVAPAALLSTFVTSCVGEATYALAALAGRQDAAPDWPIGLACGVGGLLGGYLGASAAPHLPHDALRRLLGCAALALSALYLTIALAELSAT